MSDLRTAAQQALEALELAQTDVHWELNSPTRKFLRKAEKTLRAALAQKDEPVQEPVAKVELMTTGGNAGLATRIVEIDDHLRERLRPGQLLYTTPPQRKPLAEWQINDLMAGIDPEDVCSWSFRQGVYAAEKHHGVKP